MKKSKEKKMLNGTYRPDRDEYRGVSYKVLEAVPEPVTNFYEDSEWFYLTTSEILISAGMLTTADILELEQAAMTYGLLQESFRKIQEVGAVQTTQSGYTQKSAHWQTFMEASKRLNTFYDTYGFNSQSRLRIEMERPYELDDMDKI